MKIAVVLEFGTYLVISYPKRGLDQATDQVPVPQPKEYAPKPLAVKGSYYISAYCNIFSIYFP